MKMFLLCFLTLTAACSSFAKKPVAPKDPSMVDIETIIKMLKDKNEAIYGYTPYKIGYMTIGKSPQGVEYIWTCEVPGMLIFDQVVFAKVPNEYKVNQVSNAMLQCKELATKNKQNPLNKI